ncbi:MAG: hypothetical protein ACXU7E_08445 [Croceibacterium sp.]
MVRCTRETQCLKEFQRLAPEGTVMDGEYRLREFDDALATIWLTR